MLIKIIRFLIICLVLRGLWRYGHYFLGYYILIISPEPKAAPKTYLISDDQESGFTELHYKIRRCRSEAALESCFVELKAFHDQFTGPIADQQLADLIIVYTEALNRLKGLPVYQSAKNDLLN